MEAVKTAIISILLFLIPIPYEIKLQISIILNAIMSENAMEYFKKHIPLLERKPNGTIVKSYTTYMNWQRDIKNKTFIMVKKYLESKFSDKIKMMLHDNIRTMTFENKGKIVDKYNGSDVTINYYTKNDDIDIDKHANCIFELNVKKADLVNYMEHISSYVLKNSPSFQYIIDTNIEINNETKNSVVTLVKKINTTKKTFTNNPYSDNVMNNFVKDCENFVKDKKFYEERGMNHKRGYLFAGIPGSGKTTLVKIISKMYGCDIYVIAMSSITSNKILADVMSKIDADLTSDRNLHICLYEDFDRSIFMDGKSDVSMDVFLNIIDGVDTPEGRISIFTANDSKKILSHDALTRPGRIDKIIEFTHCTKTQISQMYEMFYNKTFPKNIETVNKYSSATVMNMLISNIDNSKKFLKCISCVN